jgi:hypothetical protein
MVFTFYDTSLDEYFTVIWWQDGCLDVLAVWYELSAAVKWRVHDDVMMKNMLASKTKVEKAPKGFRFPGVLILSI